MNKPHRQDSQRFVAESCIDGGRTTATISTTSGCALLDRVLHALRKEPYSGQHPLNQDGRLDIIEAARATS